jgi:hypothetical protein
LYIYFKKKFVSLIVCIIINIYGSITVPARSNITIVKARWSTPTIVNMSCIIAGCWFHFVGKQTLWLLKRRWSVRRFQRLCLLGTGTRFGSTITFLLYINYSMIMNLMNINVSTTWSPVLSLVRYVALRFNTQDKMWKTANKQYYCWI